MDRLCRDPRYQLLCSLAAALVFLQTSYEHVYQDLVDSDLSAAVLSVHPMPSAPSSASVYHIGVPSAPVLGAINHCIGSALATEAYVGFPPLPRPSPIAPVTSTPASAAAAENFDSADKDVSVDPSVPLVPAAAAENVVPLPAAQDDVENVTASDGTEKEIPPAAEGLGNVLLREMEARPPQRSQNHDSTVPSPAVTSEDGRPSCNSPPSAAAAPRSCPPHPPSFSPPVHLLPIPGPPPLPPPPLPPPSQTQSTPTATNSLVPRTIQKSRPIALRRQMDAGSAARAQSRSQASASAASGPSLPIIPVVYVPPTPKPGYPVRPTPDQRAPDDVAPVSLSGTSESGAHNAGQGDGCSGGRRRTCKKNQTRKPNLKRNANHRRSGGNTGGKGSRRGGGRGGRSFFNAGNRS